MEGRLNAWIRFKVRALRDSPNVAAEEVVKDHPSASPLRVASDPEHVRVGNLRDLE